MKGTEGKGQDTEGFPKPYTNDTDLIVSNHPMIIMAEENRRVSYCC